MLIGIDIDGVILDFEKFVKERGSKELQLPIINECGRDIAEIFGVSMEVENEFWKNNTLDYVDNTPIKEGVYDFIECLIKERNKWVIITDRCRDLSYCGWEESIMMYYVENMIDKIIRKVGGIGFCGIYYTHGDKLTVCKELGVDLMSEDSVRHLTTISTELPMIKVYANYNRDLVLPNVFPVKNLDGNEAMDIVRNISINKRGA